jgi:hypothetical protein
MTPTALQIFATLFALFALSRVFLRVKAHQLMIREALFWGIIWCGIIVVLWVPDITTPLATMLGLSTRQPVDTLVYIAIVVLFYLIYRIHAKQEELQHDVTRLIRIVSIQEAKGPKGKS